MKRFVAVFQATEATRGTRWGLRLLGGLRIRGDLPKERDCFREKGIGQLKPANECRLIDRTSFLGVAVLSPYAL